MVAFAGIEAYNSTVPGISICNAGWKGATSASLIDQSSPGAPLNALLSVNPDAVFTSIGINDANSSVPLSTYLSNLSTYVSTLTAPTVIRTETASTISSQTLTFGPYAGSAGGIPATVILLQQLADLTTPTLIPVGSYVTGIFPLTQTVTINANVSVIFCREIGGF